MAHMPLCARRLRGNRGRRGLGSARRRSYHRHLAALVFAALFAAGCGEPAAGGRSATEWEALLGADPGFAQELRKLGPAGGEVWLRLSRSPSRPVRILAAEALPNLWRWLGEHPDGSTAALVALALDADPEVRHLAGLGLVRLPPAEMRGEVPQLIVHLMDLGLEGARSIAEELAWISPLPASLRDALTSEDPAARVSPGRCAVLLAHGHATPRALAEARRLVADAATPAALRVRLLRSVVRSAQTARSIRPELATLLRVAPEREVRFLAGLALLAAGPPLPGDPSVQVPEQSEEDDVGLRTVTALARARLKGSSPDPELLAEARDSEFVPVRLLAAQWDLARAPTNAGALEVVTSVLDSSVGGRRCEAIERLLLLGARPESLRPRIERIRREDEYWRAAMEADRFLSTDARLR